MDDANVATSRQDAIQAVTRLEDLPGTTNDEVQALLDLQLNYQSQQIKIDDNEQQ